jgi:glycosyl transferase, family 25
MSNASLTLSNSQTPIMQDFELYVINLDRSTQRWQRIEAHLLTMKLEPQRISAVDAAQCDADTLAQHYSQAVNQKTFFMALKPAEIGCFLSHRKALEAFLKNSEKPYAIILEDDVEFINNPNQYQAQWREVLTGHKPAMVKLFKRRPINGQQVVKAAGSAIVRPKLVPLGTQAQVVNRAGAQALLDAFDQFGMPVDVAYQYWWQHGVEVLVTVPNQINEISQVVGGTNIGGSQGFSFGYKAKREVKRSWFRLKLKLVSAWYYNQKTASQLTKAPANKEPSQ